MKTIILSCNECGQRYDLKHQVEVSKNGVIRCPRCGHIVGYEKMPSHR